VSSVAPQNLFEVTQSPCSSTAQTSSRNEAAYLLSDKHTQTEPVLEMIEDQWHPSSFRFYYSNETFNDAIEIINKNRYDNGSNRITKRDRSPDFILGDFIGLCRDLP
jgi:hypothetical protein